MNIRSFSAALIATTFLLVGGAAHAATEIVEPGQEPYAVTITDGTVAPFNVEATGFKPGSVVYVEQCNGRAPNEPNWLPARDCDLGSSPAGALVDGDGRVAFSADDPNHRFQPFVGASPQELFNCVARGVQAPDNGLTNHETCQVRVSTSNLESTADQVFLPLSFGATPAESSSDSFPWIAVVIVVAAVAVVIGVIAARPRRERRGALR